MTSYTFRELQLKTDGNIAAQVSLALAFAGSAQDLLEQVDPAIDHILQEFSRTPKERQGRSEDALSIDLVTALKMLGFQASHDTTTGGHCDIVIDGKFDFLWLGEAKIHGAYDWLLQGFNQLDSRYATANQGQDRGGLIIYHFSERSDRVMDAWEEHLRVSRQDVTIEERAKGKLEMRTIHTHARTGRQYHVRHVIVSLYWNPKK
jgi:hypothetical protein